MNSGSQDAGSMQGSLDSITLGQLKAMVGSAPKPKVCASQLPDSLPD